MAEIVDFPRSANGDAVDAVLLPQQPPLWEQTPEMARAAMERKIVNTVAVHGADAVLDSLQWSSAVHKEMERLLTVSEAGKAWAAWQDENPALAEVLLASQEEVPATSQVA